MAGSGSYLPRWFRMKYGSFARSIVSSASLRSLSLRSMASCCVERAGHGEGSGKARSGGRGRGGTRALLIRPVGRLGLGDAGLTCADATPAPPILLPCSRASINDMATLSVRSTLRRSHSPRRERVASDLAGRRGDILRLEFRAELFSSSVAGIRVSEMPRPDWPVVPRLALSATTPGIGQLDPRPRAGLELLAPRTR